MPERPRLEEAGVWVSEASDWGRQSSPVAMAIETREQGENEISGRGLVARRNINLYEEIYTNSLNKHKTTNNNKSHKQTIQYNWQ